MSERCRRSLGRVNLSDGQSIVRCQSSVCAEDARDDRLVRALRNVSDDPSRGSCRKRDEIGGDDNHRVDRVIVKDDLKRFLESRCHPVRGQVNGVRDGC